MNDFRRPAAKNRRIRFSNRSSRGLGILEIMLLIAVISSLLIGGFLQWRVRSFETSSRQEQAQLAQADAALLAFATIAHRLPCPDTDRDGLEDCSAGAQKGWLPVGTLRLAGADPGVNNTQLRYLVQRGTTAIDLTSGADDWRPLSYDSGAIARLDTGYAGTAINTLSDLCTRVNSGGSTAWAAGMAATVATSPRLIAFALAHPGNEDGDGDGDLFDGVNAVGNPTQLEPSDRRFSLGLYDDVVLERSMASLQRAFGCDMLNNSIDATSLAYDAVVDVDEMRQGNIADAIKAVAWAAASALLSGLSAVNTGLGIASDAGNAGVDAAICAASLGLAVNACAALGVHASAAAFGGGEIAAQIVSIGLSLAAVGIAGTALGLADADSTSAPVVCTAPSNTESVARFNIEITKAEVSRTAVISERDAAVAAKVVADAARNTAIANLRAAIRGPGVASTVDGFVDPLINTANTLAPLAYSFEAAQAQVADAQSAYNNAVADVARYQDLIDNRAARITSTLSTLTTESQTLANLRAANPPTPPQTIADQETVVNKLQSDLRLLQEVVQPEQTPTLVIIRDRFIAERDNTATFNLTAANNALATATANRNGAANNYVNAYSGLLTASLGNYTITLPLGSSPSSVVSCTAGFSGGPVVCGTSTISTFSDVSARLSALFGFGADNGSATPHPDSVYNAPEKLQRKIDGLNRQITSMNENIAQMIDSRDKLSAPITLPPECASPPSPARPFRPAGALPLIMNVDRKGGTR
jgi:hypothetical protein